MSFSEQVIGDISRPTPMTVEWSRYAQSLTREVPDDAWPALRPFDTPQRDIPKDELHQQMLFLLYVFEYMNGEMWYEVNPVLRTVPRFNG